MLARTLAIDAHGARAAIALAGRLGPHVVLLAFDDVGDAQQMTAAARAHASLAPVPIGLVVPDRTWEADLLEVGATLVCLDEPALPARLAAWARVAVAAQQAQDAAVGRVWRHAGHDVSNLAHAVRMGVSLMREAGTGPEATEVLDQLETTAIEAAARGDRWRAEASPVNRPACDAGTVLRELCEARPWSAGLDVALDATDVPLPIALSACAWHEVLTQVIAHVGGSGPTRVAIASRVTGGGVRIVIEAPERRATVRWQMEA